MAELYQNNRFKLKFHEGSVTGKKLNGVLDSEVLQILAKRADAVHNNARLQLALKDCINIMAKIEAGDATAAAAADPVTGAADPQPAAAAPVPDPPSPAPAGATNPPPSDAPAPADPNPAPAAPPAAPAAPAPAPTSPTQSPPKDTTADLLAAADAWTKPKKGK